MKKCRALHYTVENWPPIVLLDVGERFGGRVFDKVHFDGRIVIQPVDSGLKELLRLYFWHLLSQNSFRPMCVSILLFCFNKIVIV